MPVRDLLSAASTQGALPSDPNFEYNTLLLNGDGTNGAQNNTFLDSSTNNFTITRNGNTTQGSFSPYGPNWSNYFNGSSYLTFPNSSSVSMGTGDFTFESWIYGTGLSTADNIIFSAGHNGFNIILRTTAIAVGQSFVAYNNIFSTTINNGTWYNIAIVRQSGTIYCYVNGVSVGSAANTTDYTQTTGGGIGADEAGGYPAPSKTYLSNLRVVKGTALYPNGTTYTPSITPLTAISGTGILTCQSNRFIDNSSNAIALSVGGGSPQVTRFSPFNPTAPYSTSVIGGSGYFDGSGDYLTLAASSSWSLPADFTWECWAYPTSAAADARILHQGSTGTQKMIFYMTSGAGFNFYYDGGSNYIVSSIGLKLNAWNHIAGVRNGSTITIYINGVSGGTATSSTTLGDSSLGFAIGSNGGGSDPFPGYVSDARIVKGTAVYTTTFTPPTAPLTAITNTQLLTSMTNAGIPDLAMQNDYETLGSAQVTTSVKKYGTGSISFAGSTSDYIKSAPTPNGWNFGTSDFTVEMWLYPIAATSRTIMANRTGTVGTSNAWSFEFFVTAQRLEWHTGLAIIASSSTNIALSTWTHVAVVRSGGTLTIYQGGTSVASASDSNNYSEVNSLLIGYEPVFPSTNGAFYGYMDDIRITKGLARYTANFTPPIAALPTY
jgi:hypothetical protein